MRCCHDGNPHRPILGFVVFQWVGRNSGLPLNLRNGGVGRSRSGPTSDSRHFPHFGELVRRFRRTNPVTEIGDWFSPELAETYLPNFGEVMNSTVYS